jgi:hypothetical protein
LQAARRPAIVHLVIGIRRLLRSVILLAAIGLVACAVAGCLTSDQGGAGLRFTNHTDRTVTVTAIDATGHELAEPIIHALKPGEAIVANDRFLVSACSDAYTLVALDEHGAEIARRAGRICAPGDWVIEPTP